MTDLEAVRAGIEGFLRREWDEEVEVGELSPVSAGARRLNVLFDARRSGETLGLAVTVVPTAAIQIVSTEAEAANLRLAEAAGVPVPHVHAVCTDEAWVGGPFIVSSRVPGVSVARQILRLAADHDGLGAKVGFQLGEAMARLHAADAEDAHPSLRRPEDGSPVRSGLAALREQLDVLLQPSPTFALAYRWLERHRPPDPDRLVFVHGDFRHGNILVTADNGLEAVLDWEGCHLGDGMEDVAWMCQRMWRFRNDRLEVGGLADRADLRAGYEAAGGTWDDHSFHWWKVYGALRWGMGLAGQSRQHLDRSFRSVIMAGSGRRCAEMEYDLLMLLRGSYEP
ncbi:MAG: phosphotransferase family protein [Thermoanaerobaculia bacterium]|nr:phosphotransferase family protein [Thermoanaerobaculia bacterium]